MHRVIFLLTALCLLCITPALGDEIVDDVEEARQLLTGPKQRSWILEAVEAGLGGAECEAGERYVFSIDGTLVIERCEAGAWVRDHLTWAIGGGGAAGLDIDITGERHDLILVKRADLIEMLLIALAEAKDQETVERLLIYPLD